MMLVVVEAVVMTLHYLDLGPQCSVWLTAAAASENRFSQRVLGQAVLYANNENQSVELNSCVCALLALLNTNSDLQICTLRNVCKWMSLLWSRASLCVSPATQTTFSKHQQKVQVIWRLCAAQFFSLCALVLLNLGLKTKTKMIHFPVATNTSQRWVKCEAKSCCHGFRIIFYLKITDSQKFKWFFVCFSQDFVQKQSVQLNRADADYQQTIMFSSWELWLVCVVGDNYFRLNICIPPILNTIEDWQLFPSWIDICIALLYCCKKCTFLLRSLCIPPWSWVSLLNASYFSAAKIAADLPLRNFPTLHYSLSPNYKYWIQLSTMKHF